MEGLIKEDGGGGERGPLSGISDTKCFDTDATQPAQNAGVEFSKTE